MRQGFAVWLTGLPASGKSTLAGALHRELTGRGVNVAVLESDALRRILTPNPGYGDTERDAFYAGMAFIGCLLTRHGVSVIFDATANRRAYRDRARRQIPDFLEVHVACPLSVCEARDPKGIYRRGREGKAPNVPGIQAVYEPPLHPDSVVQGDTEKPADAARRIVTLLEEKGYL
ncbi:MAG TPA: adenylyl-sulfate kinase [Candidatus Limnocylindrales bacterium]|nr:adenylyl-sulfate kinase [Candidatus Limnocylindrales bacterium]